MLEFNKFNKKLNLEPVVKINGKLIILIGNIASVGGLVSISVITEKDL